MDKKLRKKIESQLVITMQGILSRIHPPASADAKKKIKEAGKMVAKKFAKSFDALENKKLLAKGGKKKSKKVKNKKVVKRSSRKSQKRDRNGRFQKKK